MAFQGASSSSSTSRWTHDLFLSFRGEDTRHNFTAHLHKALLQKGIITFIDDEIRRGEEISPALVEAIQKSRISIIIFSQTYASSRWCLDEVLEILECKKTKRQMVLPVFYKVDPSDVRYQKNSFKKAFAKHEERFKDDLKVQQWKAALKQVADLAGYAFVSGNEAKFIDKIVQNVSRIMNHTYLHVANYPVGIESRVREINSLLSIHEMNDIRMVGILGAGGIGKTTIAKDIYNSIYSQFDGCCFLETIREASKKHFGMVKLQSTLLSKILGHTVRVDSVGEGIIMIKKRLDSKKVLLILDDIDDKLLQLDKLAGGLDWFGSGSRIIITTRDRKVLTDHEVVDDLIYKVKELDRNEALELFRWNAFKGAQPTDDSLKLMEHAISYAGGLPLALEVLGSYLYRKDIHEWKDALNKYKCSPHKSIQKILRTSYDGLHDTEKNIFLDIACFFKGKPADEVIKILDSCKFFPKDGIKVLIEKSLITIFGLNTLQMHDLLQDMGREIVREESPEDPSKRSRLWFHEDVRQVLEEDTEHREHSCFDIVVSGNKIPDWFNYRKEVSNSNSCEIDIDVPADLDGEITRIAFSAVVDKMYSSVPVIWFYVISGGVEIYSDIKAFFHFSSDCVWLHFHVLESFKRKEYNGHLRVKFVCEGSFTAMKSCGFHMARMCEEKTRDSIDGIQVTKRPRDYGNLESNWYPQQKRHSSSSGVRISYAEAEAEEF